jgi:hypothetical protein
VAARLRIYAATGGHGVPPLQVRPKWGLDWIHKLHPAPDQLFHQVADDRDHRGFKLPDQDIADYGWGPNSYRPVYFANGKPQGLREWKSKATGVANIAGRSAAAMAIAYRIWSNDLRDPLFAQKCLKAALELYELGKRLEGYQDEAARSVNSSEDLSVSHSLSPLLVQTNIRAIHFPIFSLLTFIFES